MQLTAQRRVATVAGVERVETARGNLLTIEDVAARIGTTTKQARNMRQRGQLPPSANVPGVSLRWRVADIEAFIARQASGASSGPRLLSVAQVAERLGMSAGAVYQMGDRLPGRVKIGSRVRYQEEAIAAIVERGLCQ